MSENEICFVSTNKKKKEEIEKLIPQPYKLLGLQDIGYHKAIEETGSTFYHNALIKAKTIFDIYAIPTLADDSGLVVKSLGDVPGVYSARYAGVGASDTENNKKLLDKLDGVKDRQAYFQTSLVYIDGKSNIYHFEGRVNGSITSAIGEGRSFGYDPIFIPDGYKKVFSMFSIEEKNKISHRGIAIRKFVDLIKRLS